MRFSDESLARRLEDVQNRFMLEWLDGTSAELARFGGAVAALDASRPELDFVNRVYGLWPEDADRVEEIAARYRGAAVRGWLELAPCERFEALARAVAVAGGAQIGFHTVVYGPASARVSDGDVELDGSPDPELFADVLLRGHGVPEGARDRDRGSVARWAELDGWRLYLARVDGEPAGAGLLSLEDDVGYLANASTLSDYRRRGVQTALIARRIADAAAAGCDTVCSGAAFGSQSQRNLERAGLRVAYTKAVWRLH
jgi:ribosomal protein S18 acetylase RimI-like enzyme